MQTILMPFMLFHLLTESSALLDHSARGVHFMHFILRCSSNQCALVTQIKFTTSAFAVTLSSGFAVIGGLTWSKLELNLDITHVRVTYKSKMDLIISN